MADASLLGLIAAVSLPLAYAQAVRRGWGLPAALAGAIAAYVAIASAAGLPPSRRIRPARLGVSFGSILVASYLASRIGGPADAGPQRRRRDAGSALVRTVIPVVYVAIVGIVTSSAGPRWAGLVSTFPSMSAVVVAVTHLEAGAVEASRIARALPPANLSTAAFLAAFRFGCPVLGLGLGDALRLCRRVDQPGGDRVDPRSLRLAASVRFARLAYPPARYGTGCDRPASFGTSSAHGTAGRRGTASGCDLPIAGISPRSSKSCPAERRRASRRGARVGWPGRCRARPDCPHRDRARFLRRTVGVR